MNDNDYLDIAIKYAKSKGYNIVEYAGCQENLKFYIYTKLNLPRYGSLPCALSIDNSGKVTELNSTYERMLISNMAFKLKQK